MTAATFAYIPLCTPVGTDGSCDTPYHHDSTGRCVSGDRPSAGKRPQQNEWQKKRWQVRPKGNAGVLCGKEHGLFVFDVDSPEAQARYDGWSLPETYTVKTGNGRHYYWQWPNGVDRLPGWFEDILVRCNGQVVAPGSTHMNGRVYALEIDVPVRTLPEDFVRRFKKGGASANRSAPSLGARFPKSTRTKSIESLAGTLLHRNVVLEAALAAAATHNEMMCDPPLPAAKVEETVRGIYSRYEPTAPLVAEEQELGERLWTSAPENRPEIKVSNEELHIKAESALRALIRANDPPVLLRQGDVLVRAARDGEGEPVRLIPVTRQALRGRLSRVASWYTINEKRERKPVSPPLDVVDEILANLWEDLPPVERVVHAPVYDTTGTLCSKPGYNPSARVWLDLEDVDLPEVPRVPTRDQVEAAVKLLNEELLGEFPFVADSDRAHALALGLLPFVRNLINGVTPLHLVEASLHGTGKNLAVDGVLLPSLGSEVRRMAHWHDEDEARKRLLAKMLSGEPVVCIDNVRETLDSGVLAAVLTSPNFEDRLLGQSRIVSAKNRAVWLVTANNPILSGEIARRSVRIRLDANLERPYLRTGFRHPQLLRWAREHRGELLGAYLTIVNHWLAEDRPRGKEHLGSFEAWAETLGGILASAGVPGFLGNIAEFLAAADGEADVVKAFVAQWWATYGTTAVGTGDLWKLTDDLDLGIGEGSERSQRTAFGKWLSRTLRDRVVGPFRVVNIGTYKGAAQYHLAFVDGSTEPESVNMFTDKPAGQSVSVNIGEHPDALHTSEVLDSVAGVTTFTDVHHVHQPPCHRRWCEEPGTIQSPDSGRWLCDEHAAEMAWSQ